VKSTRLSTQLCFEKKRENKKECRLRLTKIQSLARKRILISFYTESLFHIHTWLKKIRESESMGQNLYRLLTTRRKTCLPVILNGPRISQAENARYLGLCLDRRPEKAHIHRARTTWNSTEQDALDARQQVAAVESKLLWYKAILKPMWTRGVQLWGTAANSNMEIIQTH